MEEKRKLLADLTSGEDERAEAAVAGLAQYGAQILPDLKELLEGAAGLRSQDVDLRWWVLRALAEISDAQVTPLLIAALHDEDAAIRQCAAMGARKQPDPQTVPALIEMLSDKDHLCASLAADALATIGAPSVPALIEVLQNGRQSARLEAVRALANIGDQRSIPALFNVLDEESALLEYWATEGLERMGVGMNFFEP
jgi:HEAT repeat protein